ncbi:HflK protein [Bathymodiolus thermophilus thioautotrophic gill symbiont]|jgi:membrane protease subunit HflK|uniref:Protein HflK n=3 Tax=sulfur-oxidizing symbionts TaxID=32036 RepID=A0A1H6MA80_9GAMM|nr:MULTISPECIES: FtsH protease activity modulator HflK [sulfur-oxidizing symbionts]CAC9978270.1 HflK protein [uncultured Gammaproteobacteria bacterium]CAB5498073.1 HflK protein [Bathymodiolus azoricus thioautotrophic gill symbiont]CAB5507727.1 HflK protein [Bathymodiolus thermophilus thioautotrophic gill symbiont]SEH78755.1 membrane protease HflK [Bathymodiolus azoricus thioautotrophic gill symbiont]SEH94383.1 membrane protease subunit HflK [Bathymodiolus azoricus thioautotrophic gill symbiont
MTNNKKNPWGGDNQTPPELDEVIRDFKNKFGNIFGGVSSKSGAPIVSKTPIFKYLSILALLVWLGYGFYIIAPAEKGVILRFGAFQEETSQGPHWHLPYPIESLNRINVEAIQDMQIGYRDAVRNRRGGNVSSESLMLTKDENMINAKFAVQYKINDAQKYLFNVANPKLTLRQVVESAIRQVVGKNSMDYILIEGRAAIADSIKEKSQELLDVYAVGLLITTINMQDVQPPEPVQAAFSDAVKAREDKQRLINEAQTYANDILPKSRGRAARMLEEARGYKSKVVSKSEGEAARFKKILTEYQKAPGVTRERLYRETMENVLANTSKVVVDSKANNMMVLPIDKLLDNKAAHTNKIVIQGSQSQQVKQDGSIRNVFRNREVR